MNGSGQNNWIQSRSKVEKILFVLIELSMFRSFTILQSFRRRESYISVEFNLISQKINFNELVWKWIIDGLKQLMVEIRYYMSVIQCFFFVVYLDIGEIQVVFL